ncbi:hypothetical protein [Acinetobacter amyesii]|uniref:hypothetical protein n=1 Tax=Acinetobacter amyesii TaxID=2942470 RepID=UPI003F111FB4
MAMKQTQTKLFDFSDVGLDFCAGSKNLFPDRFKRMLTLGYNSQTVASVSVVGNQVTFEYGVSHGYVADRVLKVNSGPLAEINGGEFVVDSVTATSLNMTVDAAPISISGNFTTKIAPLGWDLVYEQPYIHIYKMRHIDDTDRFVRICFQSNIDDRNALVVCIGKSFDAATGVINDPLALQSTAGVTNASTANIPKWDSYSTSSTQNNWTYSQGLSTFGRGMCVGSQYHFAYLTGDGYPVSHHIYGIFPCHCLDYPALDYPVLIGLSTSSAHMYGNFSTNTGGSASIGNIRVRFDYANSASSESLLSSNTGAMPQSSFLTAEIESFNTTTGKPLEVYEQATRQYLGQVYGLYLCMYAPTNMPSPSVQNYPSTALDVDGNLIVMAASGSNNINSLNQTRLLAIPIEEIKIV